MKKIGIIVGFLATLLFMACNTSKNSTTSVPPPPPPPAPEKYVKGELKESDMKVTQPSQYEKKALPIKGRLLPMETAAIVPDTL